MQYLENISGGRKGLINEAIAIVCAGMIGTTTADMLIEMAPLRDENNK